MHIPMCLCKVSFLTTLDIYKDYFEGRRTCIIVSLHALCDLMQKVAEFIILSIKATASLRQGLCDQGASWSSLLMN